MAGWGARNCILRCGSECATPGTASHHLWEHTSEHLSASGRIAHLRDRAPSVASLGASRVDSPTGNLQLSGSGAVAHPVRAACRSRARGLDPRVDHGHEGRLRHGQPAARNPRGAHRIAPRLPPSRRHGRSRPRPVALRLRTRRPAGERRGCFGTRAAAPACAGGTAPHAGALPGCGPRRREQR